MLNKFLFGNKQIPEMYFGNIPVVRIYLGTTLIWEKENYVPYDSTCTVTVTLSQNKKAWIVTITKNGEDVTDSLQKMDTWIYNGKGERVKPHTANSNIIDLSQYPRGDYRLDLAHIASKAGGDFPERGAISFPDHIYIGTLLAGSQNAAIEFSPSADTNLSSISIFATGNNPAQTSVKVYVVHESGLCVSKGSGDTVSQMTMYGLSGYKHTISLLNNSKLFAGEKYYIIYQSNNASDFYPAYFQNENGNYKNGVTVASYADPEISSYYQIETGNTATFAGVFLSSQGIFSIPTGNWFAWGGGYGVAGLSTYRMYRRTNVGSQYQFVGIIGNPDGQPKFGASQAQALLDKPANGEFIWYCSSGGTPSIGLTYGDIYTKYSTGTIYSNENTKVVDVDTESSNREIEIADILYGLSQKSNVLTGGGNYHYNRMGGYIVTLKSTYTNKVTSSTPLTSLPSNPQSNEIYYLSNSISGINTTGAYVYNGSWTLLDFNNWTTYLNATDIGSVLTRVGSNTDFLEEIRVNSNTVDVEQTLQDYFNASVSTDKKFYLEINGKEV